MQLSLEPEVIERVLDFWGRARIELDMFFYGFDTVDKIFVFCALAGILAIAWILWELATWNNTGSSST